MAKVVDSAKWERMRAQACLLEDLAGASAWAEELGIASAQKEIAALALNIQSHKKWIKKDGVA